MSVSFRHTTTFELPRFGIGARQHVIFHEYVPADGKPFNPEEDLSVEDFGVERAYIQASLHCDELPGMLVSHHLLKLLDVAAEKNGILKPITIVPYANPIGLQQIVMGSHLGRFSLSTGVNFNRDWIDVTAAVAERVRAGLSATDIQSNSAVIRKALLEETRKLRFNTVEKVLKQELFQRAAVSSIVLDLHCDCDAIMHAYTHDLLWPQMRDLTVQLEAQVMLLASESGGTPFDEACSCPWATLKNRFQDFPIDMACQAVTIELRGESDVYDELAKKDAIRLYDFFAGRGFLVSRDILRLESDITIIDPTVVLREQPDAFDARPLVGVDMIEGAKPGLLAWKVRPGDEVVEGQLLGEIVDVEDIDAARLPITARNSGIVYGMRRHKLSWPGETIIKVAGKESLQWRKGNLLTL